MTDYFFDTYALIEITKNNPYYVKYADEWVITSIFNLTELFYAMLRDFGEEKARGIFYKFKECIIDIPDDVIFEAMKLKLKNKRLSYIDCVGYVLALKNNLLFLTGDKEFKVMPHVEFVE